MRSQEFSFELMTSQEFVYIWWGHKNLFIFDEVTRHCLCFQVTLACGGSAAENCTYIVQATTTTLTSPCTYKICPCNTNICRIRFDFQVSNWTGRSCLTWLRRLPCLNYSNIWICEIYKMSRLTITFKRNVSMFSQVPIIQYLSLFPYQTHDKDICQMLYFFYFLIYIWVANIFSEFCISCSRDSSCCNNITKW